MWARPFCLWHRADTYGSATLPALLPEMGRKHLQGGDTGASRHVTNHGDIAHLPPRMESRGAAAAGSLAAVASGLSARIGGTASRRSTQSK